VGGNAFLSFMKSEEFIDQMDKYQLLEKSLRRGIRGNVVFK
jgi:hypothetical protein